MTFYHQSVLLTEVLDALKPGKNKIFLDVTFGGGGHSRALLNADESVIVYALDWDENALTNSKAIEEEFKGRLKVFNGNFANLYKISKRENFPKFDGILADFGTSTNQIFFKNGFSFLVDTPLDMRMSYCHTQKTAHDIVNYASLKELEYIFFTFADERYSRAVAREICKDRQTYTIKTTLELANIVNRVIPKGKSNINPATKVFQALRICVNHELDNIITFLPSSINLLKDGGKMVCISFHSLEDRLVKQFFKQEEKKGDFCIIKPDFISAKEDEVKANPSSRSAKMRVLEKKMKA